MTLTPWPLLLPIGYKQVTGPAYTQGEGMTERCKYQETGITCAHTNDRFRLTS